MKIDIEKTERGFALARFIDIYGSRCSVQKSSLADRDAVWVGVDEANPQILASKISEEGTGWVPFPIPSDVLLTTRMHLDREQARDLGKMLLRFSRSGDVKLSLWDRWIAPLLEKIVDPHPELDESHSSTRASPEI